MTPGSPRVERGTTGRPHPSRRGRAEHGAHPRAHPRTPGLRGGDCSERARGSRTPRRRHDRPHGQRPEHAEDGRHDSAAGLARGGPPRGRRADRVRYGWHRGRGDETRGCRLLDQALRPRGADPRRRASTGGKLPAPRSRSAASGSRDTASLRRAHRRRTRDAGRLPDHRGGEPQQEYRPHHRSEWHRQGVGRAYHPRAVPLVEGAFHRGQLRSLLGSPPRESALRAPPRRLHRGDR